MLNKHVKGTKHDMESVQISVSNLLHLWVKEMGRKARDCRNLWLQPVQTINSFIKHLQGAIQTGNLWLGPPSPLSHKSYTLPLICLPRARWHVPRIPASLPPGLPSHLGSVGLEGSRAQPPAVRASLRLSANIYWMFPMVQELQQALESHRKEMNRFLLIFF